MSVLTEASRAANAHLEKVAPEAVKVNGVQMWFWSAIYDAFMAGAAFERKQCAEYIREKSAEVYGENANVVEHEEAALWLLEERPI
jgi:hypothetical protein